MDKILKVRKVGDYIRYLGGKKQHPLVGIVDYAALSPICHSLNNYSVYGVFIHEHLTVDLKYGCGKYDYQSGGTVICFSITMPMKPCIPRKRNIHSLPTS